MPEPFLIFLDVIALIITDNFNTPSLHNTKDSKNVYTTTTGFGPSTTGHHQVFIHRFRSIRKARSCPFTIYLKNYHILYYTIIYVLSG
jgi:hypothetical protein